MGGKRAGDGRQHNVVDGRLARALYLAELLQRRIGPGEPAVRPDRDVEGAARGRLESRPGKRTEAGDRRACAPEQVTGSGDDRPQQLRSLGRLCRALDERVGEQLSG
jgi:hypothetical protein